MENQRRCEKECPVYDSSSETLTASQGHPVGATSATNNAPTSVPGEVSPLAPDKVPSSAPSGISPSAPGEVPSSAPSGVSPSAPGEVPSSAPSGISPSAPGEVPSSAPSGISPYAPGEVLLSARVGPSPSAPDGASPHLSRKASPFALGKASPFLPDNDSSFAPDNTPLEPGKASSFTPDVAPPSAPGGTSPLASRKASPLEHDKASAFLPNNVSSFAPDKVSSLEPDKASSFTRDEAAPSAPYKASPFESKTSPFARDNALTPKASPKVSPKASPFSPDKASPFAPNASPKVSSKPSPFSLSLASNYEPLPEPIADPFSDPNNPKIIPFAEITNAAYQIKQSIFITPCVKSHFHHFSPLQIYLKKEFMQYTGCFKERGARNALQAFTPEQRRRGVVAASAGNYGQAVAYHGGLLNIPSTIVMPVTSPLMKIQSCVTHGANVVLKGANMYEAKLFAMKIAKDTGAIFLSGYDHPDVIAGQGTVGLEILEQVPDVDAVVVPIGGASLIAGVSVAIKTMRPECKIIGVESSQCLGFTKALEAGHPVQVPVGPSLADGLAVPVIGFNAYATGAHLVDKMIQVDEHWIALSILRLLELEKCVVEGSGAVAVAAVISGQLSEFSGKKVVLILTGGNIDSTILGRVIDRALAADNRLVKFHVQVEDRPGGLQELCFLIGNLGVSIKDIYHERAWVQSDVFQMRIKAVCETRDEGHTQQLKEELQKKYEHLSFFGN